MKSTVNITNSPHDVESIAPLIAPARQVRPIDTNPVKCSNLYLEESTAMSKSTRSLNIKGIRMLENVNKSKSRKMKKNVQYITRLTPFTSML